jgi:hypothetical protein
MSCLPRKGCLNQFLRMNEEEPTTVGFEDAIFEYADIERGFEVDSAGSSSVTLNLHAVVLAGRLGWPLLAFFMCFHEAYLTPLGLFINNLCTLFLMVYISLKFTVMCIEIENKFPSVVTKYLMLTIYAVWFFTG